MAERLCEFESHLGHLKSRKRLNFQLRTAFLLSSVRIFTTTLYRVWKIPAKLLTFATLNAKIAQLVEHNLAKVGVAGSSPVFRSRGLAPTDDECINRTNVRMAELVDALL